MILNLSNFIHSLLLENETVIIPGFGAFISTYKPAEIQINEIKPPTKEISFTQQIKNNDGLLVEIIARNAKISQNNALKRIEKARENMLYELDKGETIIIEKVGKLSYNKKDEIQFVPFKDDNLLLDSFGLETISMKDSEEKVIEPEPVVAPIIPETKSQEEAAPEIEEAAETNQEPPAEKFKFPEFQPAPKKEEPEERKRIAWYWFLLILIPILIGGYFILNSNNKSSKTEIDVEQIPTNTESEIRDETNAITDSIQTDTSAINELSNSEEEIQETVKIQGTSKYYLVCGGFEIEENAENYILELKEKGIEGFLFGKTGKLFLVGIESFDTEAEAIKSLNEHFKTDPGLKLWIYKK